MYKNVLHDIIIVINFHVPQTLARSSPLPLPPPDSQYSSENPYFAPT